MYSLYCLIILSFSPLHIKNCRWLDPPRVSGTYLFVTFGPCEHISITPAQVSSNHGQLFRPCYKVSYASTAPFKKASSVKCTFINLKFICCRLSVNEIIFARSTFILSSKFIGKVIEICRYFTFAVCCTPHHILTALYLQCRTSKCARGMQCLICVGYSVNYWVSCATCKRGFVEIAFMSLEICLALRCLLTFCFTSTR